MRITNTHRINFVKQVWDETAKTEKLKRLERYLATLPQRVIDEAIPEYVWDQMAAVPDEFFPKATMVKSTYTYSTLREDKCTGPHSVFAWLLNANSLLTGGEGSLRMHINSDYGMRHAICRLRFDTSDIEARVATVPNVIMHSYRPDVVDFRKVVDLYGSDWIDAEYETAKQVVEELRSVENALCEIARMTADCATDKAIRQRFPEFAYLTEGWSEAAGKKAPKHRAPAPVSCGIVEALGVECER